MDPANPPSEKKSPRILILVFGFVAYILLLLLLPIPEQRITENGETKWDMTPSVGRGIFTVLKDKFGFQKTVDETPVPTPTPDVTACIQETTCEENAETSCLTNPATTFCTCMGGTASIKENPDGQQGICTLLGKDVDEWEFYNAITAAQKTTENADIPQILESEKEQGWYWGAIDQKKPGTPPEWIFSGSGSKSDCWHNIAVDCTVKQDAAFTCPETEWVDCMPTVDTAGIKFECTQEFLEWAKSNCPGFQGAAL